MDQRLSVVASLRSAETSQGRIPAGARVELWGANGDPDMMAKIQVRDGRPEVVSLTFTAQEQGRGVRTADLAGVNIDELIATAYGSMAGLLPHAPVDSAKRAERARRGRPRKVTTALLEEVARVYQANEDHHPVKAVASAFAVQRRQASHYVQQAREKGLL